MIAWWVRIDEARQGLRWALMDGDYALAAEYARYLTELHEARDADLGNLVEEEPSLHGRGTRITPTDLR